MLQLISSTNAAIIDLDYQIDLKIAKEKIGNRNCIRGNTNTQILGNASYSNSEIIKIVSETIRIGKPKGKFMYAAGCEWPWEPIELASRNLGIAKVLNEIYGVY
jgi:uroporphyrinogen-III decarboxylase